jgi:Uma2 family endonuclease
MTTPSILPKQIIDYPEDDGQPMSDNTKQFQWIVTTKENLDALYHKEPNVFVAGDLLWYPVEGDNKIRQAPDTMVVFGRPKGHRGSYRQWEEGGIAPKVVFEILSPSNRPAELQRKLEFYERYGVDEYYIYDPDNYDLTGYLRAANRLQVIEEMNGWISPTLKIRFDMTGPELVIIRPDGQRFLTFVELQEQQEQLQRQAEQAQRQTEQAKQLAENERLAKEEAQIRADRLAAQLRALGINPEA